MLYFLKVKAAQSCLTLCDFMDYTDHGILQTRIREWVTVPSSRGSSQPKDQTQVSHIADEFFTNWAIREGVSEWVKSLSCVQLFETLWTVAHQAPPSMRFSRQEYWSGLPFPSLETWILFEQIRIITWTSQVALVVKNPPASTGKLKRLGFDPWVGKIPWRRAWEPTPVFLPGEFLMGYGP